MKRPWIFAAVALLVSAACAPAGPAQPGADEVADFYRGKTVTFIVGFAPGGFDVGVRLVAEHMSKHVPGNPTIIVENMPGAGSLVAANNVYNTAPKDGSVVGVINGGRAAIEQLFEGPNVEYDVTQMQYIGSTHPFTNVLRVDSRAGITSFDEVLGPNGTELILGGTNPGSAPHDLPGLLERMIGANLRMVPGYEGTTAIRRAMESEEVDGYFGSWTRDGLERRQQGEWVLPLQVTEEPLADLPDTPTVFEYVEDEDDRQLLRFGIMIPGEISAAYWLPPGVPSDRVAALDEAFARTMADPDFQADIEEAGRFLQPLTGAELRDRIIEYMNMPDDLKEEVRELTGL